MCVHVLVEMFWLQVTVYVQCVGLWHVVAERLPNHHTGTEAMLY